ncbi:MAG: hypothetical protein NTV34_15915, partial [Proteobacteria bacterium]|nr:hypothetical protein [Pseudomonadota bacterium]
MKLRKHLRDMMPILAFTLLNPIQVSTAWAEDLPVAISTPSEKLIHPKSERKSAPHSSPKLKVNVVP